MRLIVPQDRVNAMEEYFLEKELDEAVGVAVAQAKVEAEAKGKVSSILTFLQVHFGEIPESVRETPDGHYGFGTSQRAGRQSGFGEIAGRVRSGPLMPIRIADKY